MRDKDHKVSRAIVDFARQKKISVIRLELLANIRQTARTSRKKQPEPPLMVVLSSRVLHRIQSRLVGHQG